MRRARKVWLFVVAAVLCLAGAAVAGELVDQGSPGNQGAWPVKCVSGCGISVDGGLSIGNITIDGGTVTALPPQCASPKDTFFVPDGGVCPAAPLSGRRSITLCNAVRNNQFGSPIMTVTVDGTTPTTSAGSPGQDLNVGDCITYDVPSTTQTRCVSTQTNLDAGMKITECK